ncbi:MAG: site-specific integrase [Desulfobacterales bacterium]
MFLLPEQTDKLKAKSVTLVAFQETRQKLKNGYAVKLRITHKRKPRYMATGVIVTPEDWEKIITGKARGKLADKRKVVHDKLKKAEETVLSMKTYSYELFKMKMKGHLGDWSNVWNAFDLHFDELMEDDRVTYAWSFRTAKNSFHKYCDGRPLTFDDISVEWLKKYQRWMLKKGYSHTTIGINARNLRRLYNVASTNDGASKDLNPFGTNGYIPPETRNIKKALNDREIKKIFNYNPQNLYQEYARDLFVFSYLANGANIGDILRLKHSDIKGDEIEFTRHKTEAKPKQRKIRFYYRDSMREIARKWGNSSTSVYIFKELNGTETEKERILRIKSTIKLINDQLKIIGKNIGIQPLTTMVARHSYATKLKRSGENIAYISESLGHSDLKVTEHYLDSFDSDKRKEASRILTDFDSKIS